MKITSQIEATKIRRIGQGHGLNSKVYLCHDPQLDGNIVIKEIPLVEFNSPDEYFMEASALYSNKHSKVVPVMYACKDATTVRIAMPYYQNGTLEDLLNKKNLSVRELIKIIEQVLLGLHHIHSNGFIHYDIKPTNILFGDDFTPMVADFGQSRRTSSLGTSEIPPLYPSHVTPEFFSGTHSTKQSDIFQVGLTLYRMCNGNIHFRNQWTFTSQLELIDAVSNGKFPNRDDFQLHIPLKLRRIIKKCLEIDPSQRYQTCLELSNDLVTVNKLLDWRYEPSPRGELWINETSTHEDIIEIIYNLTGKYDILSYKRRKSDGSTRNNLMQNKKNLSTIRKAYDYVYKLFRRME